MPREASRYAGDWLRLAERDWARVLDGFRACVLTTEDVRRLLGFATKLEVHAFFKEHAVPFYTLADLEHDRETSRRIGL
jgi:hypothetical protein